MADFAVEIANALAALNKAGGTFTLVARKASEYANQMLALETRKQALINGNFQKELSLQRAIVREKEKIERAERATFNRNRYGLVGGTLVTGTQNVVNSPTGRALHGAASTVGMGITGMAMAGFSGTVEGNRLAVELRLVSMELAGAFKPAIEMVTKALGVFRKFLEKLGPQEQSLLMLGGLAFGGAKLASWGGGLVGGAASAMGMGAGARMAGAGMLGWMGAGAIAQQTGYGSQLGYLGGAFSYLRGGGIGGIARGIGGPLALGSIAAEAGTGGYYSELRARGVGRTGAAVGAAGGAFMDFLSAPLKWVGIIDKTYGEEFRKRSGSGQGVFSTPEQMARFMKGTGADPNRRMVQIADAGFDTPGSAFERLTNALAKIDAQGNPQKEATTILEDIYNLLYEAVTGEEHKKSPPPVWRE